MSREKFLGLYNWSSCAWITERGKNMRFRTAEAAGDYAASQMWGRFVGPRPFYVVRKPKSISAEAAAVIDAARLVLRVYCLTSVEAAQLASALERYDEAK